jgi:WD40 repeat protein
MGRGCLFAQTLDGDAPGSSVGYRGVHVLRSWPLPDGEAQELGRFDYTPLGIWSGWFEPSGAGWLYTKGPTLYMRPLPPDGQGSRGAGGDLVVSRHDSPVHILDVHTMDFMGTDGVVVREDSGRLYSCCSLSEGRPTLAESFPKPETAGEEVFPESSGRWLAETTPRERRARLWRRANWPGARPLELRRGTSWYAAGHRFDPTGDWLVATTTNMSNLTFWPLLRPYPTIVDGYSALFRPLAFTPDSQWLVTSWADGQPRLWPVGEDMQEGARVLELPETDAVWTRMVFNPSGQRLFVVGGYGLAYVVPLDGSPARRLEGLFLPFSAAFSPSGRRVATASYYGEEDKMLRVWDLDAGERWSFDLPESVGATDGEPSSGQTGFERGIHTLAFAGESTLYSGGDGGIRRWDLDEGSHELVFAARPGYSASMRIDAERKTALVRQTRDMQECLPAELVDVEAGTARALPAFGDCVTPFALALDLSGRVAATGDRGGLLRVGRVDGGEPHVLIGHAGGVQRVAISPDLRWVASSGEDDTLRLWPMPDLDESPLHTLPHDELLAKLKSLTNLRAARDPESPNGWTIELGPFPGWRDVPTW